MANRPIDAVILSKFDTVDDKSKNFNESWNCYFDDLLYR